MNTVTYLGKMTLKNYNTRKKHIHFKAYQFFWQLEKALQHIKSNKELDLQISILGKVTQYELDVANSIKKTQNNTKIFWEKPLEDTVNFGSFYNPEMGAVFIEGALASTFLHKINGKPLAMLSSGPYGIFRGLGVSEAKTTMFLKMLNNGSYLLISRGCRNDLDIIIKVLENKNK